MQVGIVGIFLDCFLAIILYMSHFIYKRDYKWNVPRLKQNKWINIEYLWPFADLPLRVCITKTKMKKQRTYILCEEWITARSLKCFVNPFHWIIFVVIYFFEFHFKAAGKGVWKSFDFLHIWECGYFILLLTLKFNLKPLF